MKKNLLLFFLAVAFCEMTYAQIDPLLATQLQQILDDRVQYDGDHGVSACVIMPDGNVWNGTSGEGDQGIDITDTTVFHGASTAKTNIAVLLLLLDEEGLVDLDLSWDAYVDLDVQFDPAITVRQLISNTSGIADYLEVAGSGDYVTADFNHFFTPEEILEDIVSDDPDFAPGTDFWYSSSNFVLAGLIVEAVTGNTLQDELRTRIWEPLGMNHTYWGAYENYTEPRAGVWWNFGDGLMSYNTQPETSMLSYAYGCANIISTPQDLALFANALFNDEILSPNSMNELQVFSPDSYDDWSAGYALGIHNAYAFGENSVLGHDGYFTNMTDMFHSLDHDFTLVTMTNTQTNWFGIFNEMYPVIENFIETHTLEMVMENSVEVFPNPARHFVHIRSLDEALISSIELTDAQGRVVVPTFEVNKNEMRLDLAGLEKGIYALRIMNAGGRQWLAPLVIQN